MNIEVINFHLKYIGNCSYSNYEAIYYGLRQLKNDALNRLISELAQKDVQKNEGIKSEVQLLILAYLKKTHEDCQKSNLNPEIVEKTVGLAGQSLQIAFFAFFENNKIGKTQFIEAKKKLHSIAVDNELASNHVKSVLQLSDLEEEHLKHYPVYLRSTGMPFYAYNFIEAFSCFLYIITLMNNNQNKRNDVLEKLNENAALPIKRNTFSFFNFFKKEKEEKLFESLIPAWSGNGLKIDKENTVAINLTKTDAKELLKNSEKKFEILTSIIGVFYESNHPDAVAHLITTFIDEVEREAVRLINAIKNNTLIPIIEKYEHIDSYERLTRIPYSGFDFVSKEDTRLYFKSSINYDLDFDATSKDPISTLSQKDILVILNHILYRSKVPFLSMWEKGEIKYTEIKQIAFQIVELKWLLNIRLPESINQLKNGKLAGTVENRVNFEVEHYLDLTVQYFAILTNKEFDETMKYIRPMINVVGLPNETYHGNFSIFSTEPIKDPEMTEVNVQELVDRLE